MAEVGRRLPGPREVAERACRSCGRCPRWTDQARGNPHSGTRPPGADRSTWSSARRSSTRASGRSARKRYTSSCHCQRSPRWAVAGWSPSTTSMVKSWVQGWPSKRAPSTDPYSGQVWHASVAECTPRTRRSPAAPGLECLRLLFGGEGRLADGEQGQHPGGGDLAGGEVAHVGDHDGREARQLRQLDEAARGLGQHAVDTRRPVDVRGHLRHDQHVVGHAGSVGLVRRSSSGGRMHEPVNDEQGGHDVSDGTMGSEEIAGALAQLGSATLGESGGRAADRRLRPAWPGAAVAAPVYPVGCTPGDNLAVHVAVTKAPRGSVLAVDVGQVADRGYWGEVLTTAAEAAGLAGLVLDGGVRDVAALAAHGFPVFSATIALTGATKDKPGTVGVPVRGRWRAGRGRGLGGGRRRRRDVRAGARRCGRAGGGTGARGEGGRPSSRRCDPGRRPWSCSG